MPVSPIHHRRYAETPICELAIFYWHLRISTLVGAGLLASRFRLFSLILEPNASYRMRFGKNVPTTGHRAARTPKSGANVPPALTCTALAVPVPLKTAPVLTMVDEAEAIDPFIASVQGGTLGKIKTPNTTVEINTKMQAMTCGNHLNLPRCKEIAQQRAGLAMFKTTQNQCPLLVKRDESACPRQVRSSFICDPPSAEGFERQNFPRTTQHTAANGGTNPARPS